MWTRLGCAVALALVSAPLGALAQGRPILLNDRKGGRDIALELELDVSSINEEGPSDAQHTTLLPKVYGSFGLSRELELEVEIPSMFYDYAPDDDAMDEGDSTLLIGNPYLALFYADRGAHSVARIGGGIALPVVDPEDGTDTAAMLGAIATRGFMDMWLYVPQRLSLVVPAQVQMQASSIVLGADGAFALMIPIEDDDQGEDERDTEVALQLGGLIGVALGDATLGMRLQLASLVTEDEGDSTQASVMPFVQADLDGGAFIHGGLLINLDDPYGALGDGTTVWALRVGGGGRF